MTIPEAALFRATLKGEVREAWLALKESHPSESFYAFGIDIDNVASVFLIMASTEEGLLSVSERYAAQRGGEPAQYQKALRWSTGDSPRLAREQRFLLRSRELREAGPDPYDDSPEADEWFALVYDAAVDALAALDRAGTFGADIERARLVLGIWTESDEDNVDFVRKLNPVSVADRLAREIDEGHRVSEELFAARR
jgi:hypothetical protein